MAVARGGDDAVAQEKIHLHALAGHEVVVKACGGLVAHIARFGVRKADNLADLMREADFVTCHMKVTPETTGIVSREMISLMKPTAYFINASRGAILDEEAMIEALREKRIRGAAFDVYATEPIHVNHPYITELDNVIITPHIAGATNDVLVNHTRMLVSDIKRFLRGEHMLYQYRY